MRFVTLLGLLCFSFYTYSQDCKICGVYDEQSFYRYTILELNKNNEFTFHIMTWFDHVKAKGTYKVENDSIIFEQLQGDSIDWKKKYPLSKKKINLDYWHLSKTKKYKDYNSIPFRKSDLHIFVDTLIKDSLGFNKTNKSYKALLYLIIREPTYPQKTSIVLNGIPINYMFKLDFYSKSQLIEYSILDSTFTVINGSDSLKPYPNGLIRLITKPEFKDYPYPHEYLKLNKRQIKKLKKGIQLKTNTLDGLKHYATLTETLQLETI